MVGPVAASVAATVGGGVAWLSAGCRPFAQSASDSRSRPARRRTSNDAGRPGKNWLWHSLILSNRYQIGRGMATETFSQFAVATRKPVR